MFGWRNGITLVHTKDELMGQMWTEVTVLFGSRKHRRLWHPIVFPSQRWPYVTLRVTVKSWAGVLKVSRWTKTTPFSLQMEREVKTLTSSVVVVSLNVHFFPCSLFTFETRCKPQLIIHEGNAQEEKQTISVWFLAFSALPFSLCLFLQCTSWLEIK